LRPNLKVGFLESTGGTGWTRGGDQGGPGRFVTEGGKKAIDVNEGEPAKRRRVLTSSWRGKQKSKPSKNGPGPDGEGG